MPADRTLRRNPLILPFYLPSLILALSWGLLLPILPLYARQLHGSYSMVGLILAGQAIGMLLGDVPAGVLVRRLGQKPTMLLGTACTALAIAALFWASSVVVALAFLVLAGMGRSLVAVARHAYISSVASMGYRGRAIALFGGLTRMGGFLGPMAGGVLAAAYGLRFAFLAYGVANIAALTAMTVYVQEPVTQTPDRVPGIRGNLVLATLREHYRVLAAAGAGQIFAMTIRAGCSAVIPLYAADAIGLDVKAIGLIVGLASAVDMSLFYPAGWIMDHLGRKCAIVPSFLIQALGMLIVPLTSRFAGLLSAAAVIALGNGLGSGTMMTLGADLAPERNRGDFLGIWRLIGDVGQTSGPIIVGQVAELVTLPMAPLALAASGLCAALIFGLLVPEPLRARPRSPRQR